MQPKQVTSASPARARPQVGPGTRGRGAEWGECGGMAGEGQADAQSSGEQGTWSECPGEDEGTRDQPHAAPGWGGRPPAHSSGARARPRRPGSRAAPSRGAAPP